MKLNKLANILLFSLPLFFSCKKREKLKASGAQELEARLFDVPFPINKIIKFYSSDKILFESSLSKPDLINFYKSNMEYQGWDLIAELQDNLLLFKKPNKQIAVSFEFIDKSQITEVKIFLN